MAVYIVQAGEGGPAKIGFAEDVAGRMVKMQADNHTHLSLLRQFEGGAAEEAELHARFAPYRLRGEWFCFHQDMLGDLGLVDITISQTAEFTAWLYDMADREAAFGFEALTDRERRLLRRMVTKLRQPMWLTMGMRAPELWGT